MSRRPKGGRPPKPLPEGARAILESTDRRRAAALLGVSTSVAARWEADLGMPPRLRGAPAGNHRGKGCRLPPEQRRTATVYAYVTEAQAEETIAEARRQHVTVSELICRALAAYCSRRDDALPDSADLSADCEVGS